MKNFFSIFLIILLLICIGYLSAEETTESLIEVYSTSIVKKNGNTPLQIGIVKVLSREIKDLQGVFTFPDNTTLEFNWDNIEQKKYQLTFEFPEIACRQTVKVLLTADGKTIFDQAVQFNPPRKWKIYDVQVSHHDLGYADYYHLMRRDVREMGLEMALEFCRKSDDLPKESQFHWTVETSEPMIQWLGRQSEEVIDELTERIKQGRIALGGAHNSASTEHMGYEAMARLFYTPNRYVSDWLNVGPSKTALITDIVGFTRALPLYTKEADIPYFMMGRNSAAKEFDQAEDDGAFYWQAPDKDSKMTLFKSWHYYSPDRFSAYDISEVARISRAYEQNDNWPYDCILAEDSYDFGLPEFENIEGIKNWNEIYSNPVLISGTFDMYFDDLAAQQDKASFRVYDKDAPNSWADQDLTDAEYANRARLLNVKLPNVEKWSTITSALGGIYPWKDMYQAWNRLLMWAEHTNGSYAEGPISLPLSLDDKSAANITYYELEQEMHQSLIREGEEFTHNAELKMLEQLKNRITVKNKNTLVVTNTLVRDRSAYVWFDLPAGKGIKKLIEVESGNSIPFQIWYDGRALFFAEDVPSLGYRSYTLELESKNKSGEIKSVSSAPQIENDFYRIKFDQNTGGIASLYDKKLKRELVDQQAKYKLNEYLYQRIDGSSYSDGINSYHPQQAEFKVLKGNLAQLIISEVQAEGSEKIIQKVILYKNSNQIDFEIYIDKLPSGRTIQYYRSFSAKHKEALFYCLPLDIPDFTIKHELAGGVMEPIEDQFNGSSTDFYAIQNFSDISNKDWGVTLALVEPNLIEYGKPRAALWDRGDGFEKIMKKAEKSHFYLYLLNNMFFTNIRQSQPGPKTFRYSLRRHDKDWQEGKAYQFGRDAANPMTAFIIDNKNKGSLPATHFSFLELDNENIACTTIKPAEANGQGYILRLVELSGQDAVVNVKLNFVDKIEKANITNLVEVDREVPVDIINDNSIKVGIPAFGLRTIRVLPKQKKIAEIAGIKAKSTADRQIKLNWKLKGGDHKDIAYYRIYRSKLSDFKPSLRYFAANTENMNFTDSPELNLGGWQNNYIEPQTEYFYQIVPVDKSNRPGQASGIISVKTMASDEKNLPPHQVLGLEATFISNISEHNYIGLIFYTNVESDVIKYNIYRDKKKDFKAVEENLIYVMDVTTKILHSTPHDFAKVERELMEYNRQIFVDEELEPFTTYYYRVAAVDEAGNIGGLSQPVSALTEIENVQISGKGSFNEGSEAVIFTKANTDLDIRYTLDGSLPVQSSTKYTEPIIIKDDVTVTASIFLPGDSVGRGTAKRQFFKTKNYKVTYRIPYKEKWPGAGDITLIDYFRGETYIDGNWQGWEEDDMDVVIDLGEIRDIKSVALGCMQLSGQWIFFPNFVEVELSENGKAFKAAGRLETIPEWQRLPDKLADLTVTFPKSKARYIRVFAQNIKYNPEWHPAAGGKSWIFADEIIIK